MKKYKLNLEKYDVTVMAPVTKKNEDGTESRVMEQITDEYPLRANISTWLRSLGVFKSGEDIAEAVMLAKQVRACITDTIELDEREAGVLKQAVNRLVELTAEGKANLGGEIHEEAIVRVMRMEEVK
jgi:hypothetical protein